MFAFLKRRQVTFALVLWFALLLLVSYFVRRQEPEKRNCFCKRPASHDFPRNNFAARTYAHSLSLDSDNDGLPDTAELQSFMDRENFRQWFTLIAEGQFYHLSEQWNAEQRDCAGLVRLPGAKRCAGMTGPWFQKMGPGLSAVAPDVGRYSLDEGPLGEKLFPHQLWRVQRWRFSQPAHFPTLPTHARSRISTSNLSAAIAIMLNPAICFSSINPGCKSFLTT